MAAPLPIFERLPCPAVQLLHEIPDGSSHIDWMIASGGADEAQLVTFRADQRIDELPAGMAIVVERLGDHRPLYLEYEGPVSGGRGFVKRLCKGRLITAVPEGNRPLLSMRFEWFAAQDMLIVQQLQLSPLEPDQWRVACLAVHKIHAALAAARPAEEP